MIQIAQDFKKPVIKLENVLETIKVFFDSGLPKEHRKDLKKWRYYVINAEQYKNRHGVAHIIAQYEETLKIIDAAHILLTHKEELPAQISASDNEILQEQKEWDYFPFMLSKKALSNPIIVIEKFFKEITINQYNAILHEWLLIALTNKASQETLSHKEIIDVYSNLKKLYSAMWLIHQRINV